MIASADPQRTAPRLAFGVDPSRPERYSLRQARYAALAEDISDWAGAAAARGQTLSLLDVGCGWRPDDSTHQQAFSLTSFRRELRKQPSLAVETVRGFRIISGGLLRRLENYSWWWRFNRRLGELMPAACIEVQIIARKAG